MPQGAYSEAHTFAHLAGYHVVQVEEPAPRGECVSRWVSTTDAVYRPVPRTVADRLSDINDV